MTMTKMAMMMTNINKINNIWRAALTTKTLIIALISAGSLPAMNCAVMAEDNGSRTAATSREANGSKKKLVQALKFNQQHRYFGKVQLTVAADGLRMDSVSNHFAVVAKPPQWNAVVFRDDDKTVFEEEFAKFIDTGMISSIFMSFHDEDLTSKTPQHVKINNISAVRITTPDKHVFDYLPPDAKFSRKEMQFIHALYRTPTNGGIPLHFEAIAHGNEAISGRSVEGNRLLYLNTSQIKRVEINAKSFDTPNGYRRVKFVGDVTVGNQSRKGATDFNNFLEN